jgi:predicted molibdopterin-dependent oxidoreductase YjgC
MPLLRLRLLVLSGKYGRQAGIGTLPSETSPVNEGKLCVKGWNAHEFVQNPKRLKKPMIRKNGELTEVSWDEALDYTASR